MAGPSITVTHTEFPKDKPLVPDYADQLLEHIESHCKQGYVLFGHEVIIQPDGVIRTEFTWGRWPDESS